MIRALRGVSEVSFACAGCGHPRPAPFSTLRSHSRELIFDAQDAGIRVLGRLRVTGVLIFYAQVAEIYYGRSLLTMIHNQGGVLSLRRLR